MSAYFPTLYPGELLYSALARYRQHVGRPKVMYALQELFSDKKNSATFDLPVNLSQLIESVPILKRMGNRNVAESFTLVRYYLAFASNPIRKKVFDAIRTGRTSYLHLTLGLTAFKEHRVQTLRFCQDCFFEMKKSYGELYWHREHQMPSSFLCQRHDRILQLSSVSLSVVGRHEFVVPDGKSCPENSPQLLSTGDQNVLRHLRELSIRSAATLMEMPTSRNFEEWGNYYRAKVFQIGLAKSRRAIDHEKFLKAFNHFYGATLNILSQIVGSGDHSEWVCALLRKHRKLVHPIRHLILQNFLENHPHEGLPIGIPPMKCLNPLASHHGRYVVKNIDSHRNRTTTVFVHTCECGYVYTRCWNPRTKSIGNPRFKLFGPLLKPFLLKAIGDGAKVREIGRLLNLDSKTVLRQIKLCEVWSGPLVPQGFCADRLIDANSSKKIVKKKIEAEINIPRKIRIDWNECDWQLKKKLEHYAICILHQNPPERITVAALERRLNQRGWIQKRIEKMPQAKLWLSENLEAIEAFQARRITWAIDVLGGPKIAKCWKIMRMAGLKKCSRGQVMEILNLRSKEEIFS